MESDTIRERLAALRDVMRRESLDAFIFPSTDPHDGEYVPDRWQGRKWISGFGGSAGTAVVTMGEAALWTDSRYFIAAARQLEGTGFRLMREGVEGTPTIIGWLAMKLSTTRSPQVGIDGMSSPANAVHALAAGLRANGGITLRTNFDPLDAIWRNRPAVPLSPIAIHPLEYAGEGCREKVSRIRRALGERHAEGMLMTALDDIAWTLNLRGSDVECNPLFVSYLLIGPRDATLLVDRRKLTREVRSYLKDQGVETREYSDVRKAVASYGGYNMLMDPSRVNHTLFHSARCQVVGQESPVPYMKARKNPTEIEGFRRAMLRDGVAMARFLKWLGPAVEGGGVTELSASERLLGFRMEQDLFRGVSFPTISAYGENAAMVHYEPTPETSAPLRPEGLLLVDSGGQYLDGTTDITRTISLGAVTPEQRKAYTLVLKGHIQLAMLKFPEGASGTQLDALARKDMWREGFNFLHGTGHGVGSYLSVHEGPIGIRMEHRPAGFLPGMVVTDAPGLYLEGRFGVRIENTLLTVPHMETGFGRFLGFEPLTLCPIDTRPVIVGDLTPEEVGWLNGYHQRVRRELSPLLDQEHRQWLEEATREIG